MSISVMTEVWRRSQHSGSHLLMMLALADFSDDVGSSYPSVATLATKCRMKPRNANVVLAALIESGELERKPNAGPKGVNRYRIQLKALGGLQRVAGMQEDAGMQEGAGMREGAGMQEGAGPVRNRTLQSNAATPATLCLPPLHALADKPSLNRQEPSDTSLTRPQVGPKALGCPFDAVVALFHAKLPELPRVRLMPASRQRALRKVWGWVLGSTKTDGSRRATNADEALAWFGDYFARAAGNDFLMGRGARSEAHANWRCDLDFLLTEKGMKHVIEKTEVAA